MSGLFRRSQDHPSPIGYQLEFIGFLLRCLPSRERIVLRGEVQKHWTISSLFVHFGRSNLATLGGDIPGFHSRRGVHLRLIIVTCISLLTGRTTAKGSESSI